MNRHTARSAHPGGKPLTILFLFATIAISSVAQTASPHSFEVATVKAVDAKNPHPPSVLVAGDRFEATGMTLKDLIKVAYDLNYGADRQVSGGPAWTDSTAFDVKAKEDPALGAALAKLSSEQRGAQLRQMLRDLLAERFKLQVHRESRELPIYELVMAKSGPKLAPAAPQPSAGSDDGTAKPRSWLRFAGKGMLEGDGADLAMLATALSMQSEIGGRLVVDKTGLPGKYDFTLKWSPDAGLGTDAGADSGPSLFTALQEELGLRLEPAKAPVDLIVVDHAELPIAD